MFENKTRARIMYLKERLSLLGEVEKSLKFYRRVMGRGRPKKTVSPPPDPVPTPSSIPMKTIETAKTLETTKHKSNQASSSKKDEEIIEDTPKPV